MTITKICIPIIILLFVLSTPNKILAEESRIGVILPLTGTVAEWAIEATRAIEIFKTSEEVKAKNIVFEVEDGKCGQGSSAITAAQHLIVNKKVISILSGCSGEVLQIAPLLEKEKIPTICVLCGNPAVKNAGDYIFRAYPDLEQGAELLSNYIIKNSFKRIAVITETNSFTTSIKSMLESRLKDFLVLSDEIGPEETNYSSILTKIKSKKPDAIYINMASPTSYQNIIRQLNRQSIKTQLFSYNTPNQTSSLGSLGSLQEGIIFFDVSEVDTGTEDYKKFLMAYKIKFSERPESSYFLSAAYNGITSLIQAISKSTSNPEDIKNYLTNNKINAATGELRFDKNGDLEDQNLILKQIKDGKAIVLN